MFATKRESGDQNIDFVIDTNPPVINEDNDSLPNNFIEKDLQLVLKPLNMTEALFFCAKYKTRDNLITTNGILYNIISVLITSSLMCYCFYAWFGFPFNFNYEGYKFFEHLHSFLVYVLLGLGSFLNCFTNIIQKHNNVYYVLKIQNIYKILKLKESFKRFIVSNWACVILLNILQIFWILYSYFIFDVTTRGFNVSSYFWIVIDINVFYAIVILKLITKPLMDWVKNVKMDKCITSSENQYYWNMMFEVYIEISEVHTFFEKTCLHLIVFFIAQTILRSLSCITICIEMKKVTTEIETSALFAVLSLMALSWIVKNMFLIIYLSVETEKFYSAIKEVRSTCISLATASGCSETQKRVCKNIQRLQTASFKKMNACGLFLIDAVMPLGLCALITTYTIVILQFEFL